MTSSFCTGLFLYQAGYINTVISCLVLLAAACGIAVGIFHIFAIKSYEVVLKSDKEQFRRMKWRVITGIIIAILAISFNFVVLVLGGLLAKKADDQSSTITNPEAWPISVTDLPLPLHSVDILDKFVCFRISTAVLQNLLICCLWVDVILDVSYLRGQSTKEIRRGEQMGNLTPPVPHNQKNSDGLNTAEFNTLLYGWQFSVKTFSLRESWTGIENSIRVHDVRNFLFLWLS